MTGTCRVCGRQVEVSDSGQAMPCVCHLTPMGAFLRYAIDTCVNPERASRGVERDDPEDGR